MVPQHTRLTVAITTLDMGVAKCTCIHKASQSKCLTNNRSLWNHNEYERGPDPRTPLLLRHYVNTGPAYEKGEGSIVFDCGCTECESVPGFPYLEALAPAHFGEGTETRVHQFGICQTLINLSSPCRDAGHYGYRLKGSLTVLHSEDVRSTVQACVRGTIPIYCVQWMYCNVCQVRLNYIFIC